MTPLQGSQTFPFLAALLGNAAGSRGFREHKHAQDALHSLSGLEPPHHISIPKPLKKALPASISDTTPSVIRAINFNDELVAGCQKVHDVPVTNEHLPPERHAQLIVRNLRPQRGFRRCELVAHFMGALGEEDLAVELLTRLIAPPSRRPADLLGSGDGAVNRASDVTATSAAMLTIVRNQGRRRLRSPRLSARQNLFVEHATRLQVENALPAVLAELVLHFFKPVAAALYSQYHVLDDIDRRPFTAHRARARVWLRL
jgi:hypothetical protein